MSKVFSSLITIFLLCNSLLTMAQRQIVKNPENYDEQGIASYYGQRFEGRMTSTGEVFRMAEMTAASNTLPLNTYVRVTNLRNGRSVIVRINDRMNKHNERLIDLAKGAAGKLGFLQSGITRVRVEYVSREFYASSDRSLKRRTESSSEG